MRLDRPALAAAGALLLALGCGDSHMTDGDEDAAIIIPDGALNDAGTDSGPPPSAVGAACASDADCMGGTDTCIADLGNYCTTFCSADADCPTGSACVALGRGTSLCLATCDTTTPDDQCDPQLGCVTLDPGLPPVCLRGCESDSDCDTGLECLVGAGDFGAGVCADPDTDLGGACTSDADCPTGSECAPEEGSDVPGGACVLVGCNPGSGMGCPGDAVCLPGGFGGGICWDGCTTDADCRDEYFCAASGDFPDRHYCYPRFVESNLGQVCDPTGSCAGGACLNEFIDGFPSSYCAGPACDPDAEDSTCLGDGVCARTNGGGGICLDGCTIDADCREAYACRPLSGDGPLTCLPACTDSSQCTSTNPFTGRMDVCNPGTGYCGEPFDADSLGDECTGRRNECRGGRCLTEEDDGWPQGMCTYPGCSLSGATPSAACPEGSVCVDDGGDSADLGVCVSSCTVGSTSCRAGYACVAVTDGSTDGACRPACTDDSQCMARSSSGATFVCDTSTGLCESPTTD